jgi:hypothetical protein
VNGRRLGTLSTIGFGLSCSPTHLILSFRLASKRVRRRVIEALQDSFGALTIKTECLGRLEIMEVRPRPESALPLKTWRRDFQKLVEAALLKNFSKAAILHSVVHSDLEHSLSGKYVRLRFRSGSSEWHALAVSPWEDQATIDGILSSGLLWRGFLQQETVRAVDRLLLIVPAEKARVLQSRLAWIRGAGRRIHLMVMEPEQRALSFVDLRDCGNLDTALTQVESLGRLLRKAPSQVNDRPSEHLLETLILRDICSIDARLDPRFVYPQVPAFLSGDRGIIDLLTMTNEGRLAVLELKIDEDIDLPLQGLDYWLRVRWHHLRQEFQAKGYFAGAELNPAPPLLFFVCPQFRYHSSFPQLVRHFEADVPLIQIGINEDWKEGVRVVLRRDLNSRAED